MKIYSLMENTPYQPNFAAEHGLSLYIETNKHKILFDTGQSGKFIENAAQLHINLDDIELVVLSHGHYDHGGGIKQFLEYNTHAPIYISPLAFGNYYNASKKFIGLDRSLQGNSRLIFTKDILKIDDELELCSCNNLKRKYLTDSSGLTERKNDVFEPDTFLHEQYLIIHENGKKILISGCSHKGILNIMDWIHPDVLIGGFHFMRQIISKSGNTVLDQAAKILSSYPTKYYTCHCTGIEQYHYLKRKMKDQLHYLASGQSINI